MNEWILQLAPINNRLSLRPPQREALQLLHQITEFIPLHKATDNASVLEIIKREFPHIINFEREFPSLCFALATGVGKTRLMGAFINYLHLAHSINNFFILAPNLTIYNKLIAEFSDCKHPKYVFKGIAAFATNAPTIITGDNYADQANTLLNNLIRCTINIFNISKINSEVRGGKSPRIKRLAEYLGESYFTYLSNLPDLVLIMDESHRYRASAGIRAINELQPILGLELTATPFIESTRGMVPFKNVIYHYPLGKAITDGFVKEPAVITRKDFNPLTMSTVEIERLKLEDGIRLHEQVITALKTYANNNEQPLIKPFVLVIARDTIHASELLSLIQSDNFFAGRYAEKVIQVDSSKTGTEEEMMIERLLKVEQTTESTEIVIHVNMLKEGWDVTNLYTIVPLRAAHARILIEQSIGRGLRLPYGRRTGVAIIDRLNIIAHDKFQEIIDEAKKPNSIVQLQSIILDNKALVQTSTTIIAQSQLSIKLGLDSQPITNNTPLSAEQHVAQITHAVVQSLETKPQLVPTIEHLQQPEIQATIVAEVTKQYAPTQAELTGITQPNIANIVAKTTELITQQTIPIPHISLVPKGDVSSGFKLFNLQLDSLRYPPITEELWIQHLRTNQVETITLQQDTDDNTRLEDYIVTAIIEFTDIDYTRDAAVLYQLATQAVQHLRSYLSDEQIPKVLRCYQRDIAKLIHHQMQAHYWEEVTDYEVKISKGFSELKCGAYTHIIQEPLADYHVEPTDKNNIHKYLFKGFNRCLCSMQKFDSDPERKLAIILDRDVLKWLKPVKGQIPIFYRQDGISHEYEPDFIAEATKFIYMLEVKRRTELTTVMVINKQQAAIKWCKLVTEYNSKHGGKPWQYVLIPHDEIADNMSLAGLVKRFGS